jgi:hypothetical protein
MPLRRIAFVLALPLAVACAAGEEDPQPTSSEDGRPVVPFHAISGEAPEQDEDGEAIDVRSSLDERPNLRAVAGWDFEAASADCNGWTASGATAIRAIPSHTGSYACKLCADGSGPEMKLTRRVAGLPRGNWVVSAWLRRRGTSAVAVAARVSLDEATERAGIPIPLEEDWRLLGERVEIQNDVASTSLAIVATASAGECILVDDVMVESAAARSAHSSLPATPYVFMSR